MTPEQKKEILEKAKEWFKNIGIAHIANTVKLTSIDNFKYNPFLISYLTYFHAGNCDPVNIAKTLVYPRVLGTSINTSFGNAVQDFTHNVLNAFASTTNGMDIEFIDQRDMVRKYAQLKAGPETINSKDVQPMIDEFDGVLRLARQNGLKINNTNLVMCVVYGDNDTLSANYRKINERYEVLAGQVFWHALTGDENFYYDLIDVCAEIAIETNGKDLLEKTIEDLSLDPEIIELSRKLNERS